MRFNGKTVLLTGAATGLGRVAAHLFSKEGASLVLVDVHREALTTVETELRAAGARVSCLIGDVSVATTAKAAVAKAEADYGQLDVLLNNAGINPIGNIVDTTEEVWDQTMAVNLKSAYLFSKHSIPLMEKTGGGVIVNTASIASFKASTAEAAYSVSKAGLLQLTRVTAKDFASRGIRANAVCPGFLPKYMSDRRASASEDEQQARSQRAAGLVPMGREGSYEEIAELMAFLASDQSSYITGIGLTADGGQTV